MKAQETRDGGLLAAGRRCFLDTRLRDPKEQVTLIGWSRRGRSLIDGSDVDFWRVEDARGSEFEAESFELVCVSPVEFYRQLQRSTPELARGWAG